MNETQGGAGPQTGAGETRPKLRGDGEPRAERREERIAAAEPRSFGQPPSPGPLAGAAAELPLALQARHLELLSRRGHAVADYWGELSHARQPGDVLNANANYWSRFLQDYLSAAAGDVQEAPDMVVTQRPQ